MKNKTNISALEELVNSEIRIYKKNCDKIDNDILEQNIWMTVTSYYEDDKIPTKEELEYWEVSWTWEGEWKVLAYHFTKNGNCIFDRTTTLEVK